MQGQPGRETSHGVPGSRHVGAVAAFVDAIQASGRLTFTLKEIASAIPTSGRALEAALRRRAKAGAIVRVSPRTGFFLIVPPEHRGMGCPPVEWWLDDLMAFLGQPYYLGLFSAAAWHGSSHFAVMVTQVVTTTWIRPIRVGRTRIRFLQRPGVGRMPVETTQGMWGPLVVATPETVAVDLFRGSPCGVDRAALTLAELRRPLGRQRLACALEAADDIPAAQRLGYVLEWLGHIRKADTVSSWLGTHRTRIVKLNPGTCPDAAPVHPRWRVKGEMPSGLLSA